MVEGSAKHAVSLVSETFFVNREDSISNLFIVSIGFHYHKCSDFILDPSFVFANIPVIIIEGSF